MTIGARDFSAKTRKALAAQGITIVGIQAVPAFEGDAYFTGTAYMLSTGCLRSFREVLALAEGK